MKKILVIVAHPDDEILGCGATISKEIEENSEVKILFLVRDTSNTFDKDDKRKDFESIEANKILGIKKENLIYGNFPDQKLDTIPILEISHFIKKVIKDFKPNIVYTHHYNDYNSDHKIVFHATLMATRPYLNEEYPNEIYSFEILSSTEWAYQNNNTFKPNVYIKVSKQIEKKKEAMKKYTSELKEYPHPRSIEGIENLSKKRGNEISVKYAESFELIRKIK